MTGMSGQVLEAVNTGYSPKPRICLAYKLNSYDSVFSVKCQDHSPQIERITAISVKQDTYTGITKLHVSSVLAAFQKGLVTSHFSPSLLPLGTMDRSPDQLWQNDKLSLSEGIHSRSDHNCETGMCASDQDGLKL